ncbi:hypothetical protein Y032_0214g2333 [Ancylostoma ceylanicum]|uniref:Uncharacterized protein n=2 Tax=Ancylostoma ceylanicum TaxID=53326 RepID=A0A016SJB1_9BILA|nr:hypothetical protein Y032_0214g2333 [Ancylostoma ceylanicum]
MCDSRRVNSRLQRLHSMESTVGGWFSSRLIKQKDQIRVSGLTGTQLLHAIDELKKDFSRNRMEDHWLLPSISPLLALTAQELEKSRETSSIGDTQTGSADDSFSKVLQLEHVMKNAADKSDRNSGNSKATSAESLDRILFDVEEKSVQLESQLSLLERKISESKDINASTRERINQLLLRLNTSSCLVQRTCNGESDNDRKQSSTSVMSFEITENDIDRARQLNEEKLAKEPLHASGQNLVEVLKRADEAVEGASETGLDESRQSSKEDVKVDLNEAHEDHAEDVEESFQKTDAVMTQMANVSEDFHENSQENPQDEEPVEEQVESATKEEASPQNDDEGKGVPIEQHFEQEEDNVSHHSFTTNNSLPATEDQKNEVENQQNPEEQPEAYEENETASPPEEENEREGHEEKQEDEDLEGEPPVPDADEDPTKAAESENDDNNEELQEEAQVNQEESKENGSNAPSEGGDETEEAVQLKKIAEETQENSPENDESNTAEQGESQEQNGSGERLADDAGLEEQQTGENGLNGTLEVTENGEDEEQSPRDISEANTEQEENGQKRPPEQQEDQPQSNEEELSGENSGSTEVKSVENPSDKTENEDEHNSGDVGGETSNGLENDLEEFSNQGEEDAEQKTGNAFQNPPTDNATAENGDEEHFEVERSADAVPDKDSNSAQPGDSSIVLESNGSIDSPCSLLSKNGVEHQLQNLSYDINNDGTIVAHDGNANLEKDTARNAFPSPQQSEALSSLGKIAALPEFELTHKYHIQSHINTATRVPVISQPVNETIIARFADLFTKNVCTICELVQ